VFTTSRDLADVRRDVGRDGHLVQGDLGYAPLIVLLCNTKEVLYIVNRPGNLPSHTDAAPWIDRAIALVRLYAPRVCVHGDTDFSLTRHFDRWSESADVVFGMDCNHALLRRARARPEEDWQRLECGPNYETLTGTTRERYQNQTNEKDRIVRERGYLEPMCSSGGSPRNMPTYAGSGTLRLARISTCQPRASLKSPTGRPRGDGCWVGRLEPDLFGKRRRFRGWIFTAVRSLHCFVWRRSPRLRKPRSKHAKKRGSSSAASSLWLLAILRG
jgi:hypothetical protein